MIKYTKENCQSEALKYQSRKEFWRNSRGAYTASHRNHWINEICSHMNKNRVKVNRLIYAYEFEDHYVYVGLTRDLKSRNYQHLNKLAIQNSPVFYHLQQTGLSPQLLQLTDYLEENEAIKLEEYYVEKYREEGWILLNKIKTGSVGGNYRKWTKEKCREEALKYSTRTEFSKKSSSAYTVSRKNKWLDEICSHMVSLKNPTNYWNKERCIEEASKYTTRKDFYKNSRCAYVSACKNGWINEICNNMNFKFVKSRCYWNKERCRKESLKYQSKMEFYKKSMGSYKSAYKNGWIDEICSHMTIKIVKPRGYWTKERCREESQKYKSKSEFYKKSRSACDVSYRNHWMDEFFPIEKI